MGKLSWMLLLKCQWGRPWLQEFCCPSRTVGNVEGRVPWHGKAPAWETWGSWTREISWIPSGFLQSDTFHPTASQLLFPRIWLFRNGIPAGTMDADSSYVAMATDGSCHWGWFSFLSTGIPWNCCKPKIVFASGWKNSEQLFWEHWGKIQLYKT